jgi:hypothetical protein
MTFDWRIINKMILSYRNCLNVIIFKRYAVMLLILINIMNVGIATRYGLDDREVRLRVSVGSRIFPSPRRPDRLWDPPNLLSNGYRGPFPRGVKRPGVKLATHLQLVPRSRKRGSINRLPHTPSWHSA